MKKKTVILLAVLILAAVCLFNSMYTVEENEYGCTVRLSKIISTTDEPGLHFKVPFLDSVKSFPKATMLYDIPPSEVLTADKQNMTVDCYVLWSVSDPLKFYQSLGNTSVAEERLNALTYNALKTVMARFRSRTSSTWTTAQRETTFTRALPQASIRLPQTTASRSRT